MARPPLILHSKHVVVTHFSATLTDTDLGVDTKNEVGIKTHLFTSGIFSTNLLSIAIPNYLYPSASRTPPFCLLKLDRSRLGGKEFLLHVFACMEAKLILTFTLVSRRRECALARENMTYRTKYNYALFVVFYGPHTANLKSKTKLFYQAICRLTVF